MDRRIQLASVLSPSAEQALIDGCRAGEAKAQDQFFRTYSPSVERTIARLVGSSHQLEDLVQTTFIEALGSFRRFRGEASIKTWVTRIAVNVTLHQLRRGVRRTVALELLPAHEEPRDVTRPVDRQIDDRQVATRLHVLLDRMAPKKRIAFLLFTLEGYSIEEVAALMGAGSAATKSRIWFARRELLAMVKKDAMLRELTDLLSGTGA